MAVPVGTPARPPWAQPQRSHHRAGEYVRAPHEWMPRPHAGRILTQAAKERMNGVAIHLMIVPGPERTWQVVRIELNTPVARGFATRDSARKWIARAVRAGVLPDGVMEVEPNLEEKDP